MSTATLWVRRDLEELQSLLSDMGIELDAQYEDAIPSAIDCLDDLERDVEELGAQLSELRSVGALSQRTYEKARFQELLDSLVEGKRLTVAQEDDIRALYRSMGLTYTRLSA